jgi:hypothetical protein
VIGLILLIVSGDFVYMQGYFRDENNLTIPSFIHAVSWLAFLASFLIPIISLVLWNVSERARRAVKYLLILLIVIFFAWLFCRDSFSAFVKEYAGDWVYPSDGVSAELSDGLSSADENLVMILARQNTFDLQIVRQRSAANRLLLCLLTKRTLVLQYRQERRSRLGWSKDPGPPIRGDIPRMAESFIQKREVAD